MKYKVKWIEEHLGITRNMIRRYEKKGVILKNEEETSLLLRYLCFKVFKDDETKELLEANNVTQIVLN